MGLSLRYNLFRRVEAADVFAALMAFYQQTGTSLVPEDRRERRYDLYEPRGGWCVLDWDNGWEWEQRRKAQLFVSDVLQTAGLLVFVYDGDYWGYELFARGESLDQFVQTPSEANKWFPGEDTRGNPGLLADELELDEDDVLPYFVQKPAGSHPGQPNWKALDTYARPGDEYTRFEDTAVVDFLRALGVPVELRNRYVRVKSKLWRSFRPNKPTARKVG